MFLAPQTLPSFAAISEDLRLVKPQVLAKHLGVSERSIFNWKSQNNAPRAVQLALFWETTWGHSVLNCDLDNTVSRFKQLANALQYDNNTLRKRIEYLERLSDFGAANQPFLADNNTRIVTRY
jgi:hypothetical protein